VPREFARTVRVAESIKRAIAPLLNDWMRDNSTGMASVTDTQVSPDMKQSKIYVSFYGCNDKVAALKSLNQNSGKFRYALGRELRLRNHPEIKFCADDSIEKGDDMNRLLGSLKREDDDD
jgi:ribosome-binding factor A